MTRALGCPACGCCELTALMDQDEYRIDRIVAFRCCKCRNEFTQGAVGEEVERAGRARG